MPCAKWSGNSRRHRTGAQVARRVKTRSADRHLRPSRQRMNGTYCRQLTFSVVRKLERAQPAEVDPRARPVRDELRKHGPAVRTAQHEPRRLVDADSSYLVDRAAVIASPPRRRQL